MPQLRKVVLAMGDKLVYEDNFELALAELGNLERQEAARLRAQSAIGEPTAAGRQPRMPTLAERLGDLRERAQQIVDELAALARESE